MRTIYLIRHAMPDIPFGERWCVGGRTDLPLNRLGRMQAALLPFLPELRGLDAVFCSPLSRARETALPLCPAPRAVAGLAEQDMGVWDGLSFREIRERYSAVYEAREHDLSVLPEGAESLEAVRARMERALLRCLDESAGDIAVVSHRTAIASLIGHRELLLHGTVSALRWDGKRFETREIGLRPQPPLTPELAGALLEAAAPGARVIAHCRAVADEALRIAGELPLPLDRTLLESAALLHDLAKDEQDHAHAAAFYLRELGYERAAELVGQHRDLQTEALDEAAVLYLADKCVRETARVPVEERFAASAGRCRTEEARAAHRRRLDAALAVREKINGLCGRCVIE